MDVNDFFEKVKDGEISEVQIIHTTKELTNNYDPELLQALHYDLRVFEDYLIHEFECTLEKKYPDLSEVISKNYIEKGLPVPTMKVLYPISNLSNAELKKIPEKDRFNDKMVYVKIPDKEAIFWNDYYREFILLRSYKKLLEKKIEKYESPPLKIKEPPNIDHPFPCNESKELFDYLIEKWEYKRDLKFAYISNFLRGHPFQRKENDPKYEIKPTDYKRYIQKRFEFTSDIQTHNANSDTHFNSLRRLYETFKAKHLK
ncbi:MAG: hypothetical protein EA409_05625 [Saprospirales bacterium]|nr:MAG: hypothetical protein EA409_05625 [Saprospirales bacterium]